MPVNYSYDATTGLMSKVQYTKGSNTYDADYVYDGNARVSQFKDWIDATSGLFLFHRHRLTGQVWPFPVDP